MLAGGETSAGPPRWGKKLPKLCGIIALNIAQNKKDTFRLRQTAKRILAQERIILGRKLVAGSFRQFFHHCFIGGMPGPVDKEIFTDLDEAGPWAVSWSEALL